MANGDLSFQTQLPDFRQTQQFPIAAVIDAIQRKPVLEEQLRGARQDRSFKPLQVALQAAQAGSSLATQALQRAQIRERQSDVSDFANLLAQQELPARGPLQVGQTRPQLTQQGQPAIQGQLRQLAGKIVPQAFAQQLAQPPAPTIGQQVSTQASAAGVNIDPSATFPQAEEARRLRALELQSQQARQGQQPKIPAKLLEQEVELKSTLADIGTIEEELKSLPAGFFKGGIPSLAASATRGAFAPRVKAFNDNLNQRAVRFYRATTKDTRLSDFDARQSALPMMPKLTDSRETQTLKLEALKFTAQENLSLVLQAQEKAKNPNEVIRVQGIARKRLRQRGLLIERLSRFNANNPNKQILLDLKTILRIEKNLGL